jgi:thiol-disulfide isomerase/thioredoxin
VKQLLGVGILMALFGCASAPPLPKPDPGGPIDFSLALWPTSQQHSFADDRGQIVVVDAWATWCVPCRTQLPQLDALARQWAAQGVRVYAVSIDTEVQAVQPFLDTVRIDLPILLDPGGTMLTRMLGLEGMPTTWVFDRQGKRVFTEQGSAAHVAEKVNGLLRLQGNP